MNDGVLGRMEAVRNRPVPERPRYHRVLFAICGVVGVSSVIVAMTVFGMPLMNTFPVFMLSTFGTSMAILGLSDALSIDIDARAAATTETLESAILELTPTTLHIRSVAPGELELRTLEMRLEGRTMLLTSGSTQITLTDLRNPLVVEDFVRSGIQHARSVHGEGEGEVPSALRGLASEKR
jgi:hypothetical protein